MKRLHAAAILILLICLGLIAQMSTTATTNDTTVEPKYFMIMFKPGEELVRIGMDGELTYGPNYKPDAAAKIFWDTIAAAAPCRVTKEAR